MGGRNVALFFELNQRIIMNIPSIDRVVSDDDLRPAIQYALVKKDHTVVSDAHILIVHHTASIFGQEFADSLPDEGIRLSKRIIRDIKKTDVNSIVLSDDKTMISLLPHDRKIYELPVIAYKLPKYIPDFPDYMKVVPTPDDTHAIDKIKFNATLLETLGKALFPCYWNNRFMIFHFRSNTSGVLVIPSTDDDSIKKSYAVIMPAMI